MRTVAVAVYAALWLGCAVGVIFDEVSWRRFVLFPLGLVVAAVLAFRATRSGVTCTSDGVVAVLDDSTHRFRWPDIDHFEERGLRGIGVLLKTGSWTPVLYYATLGDVSPEKATARLEEARRRWQSPADEQSTGS